MRHFCLVILLLISFSSIAADDEPRSRELLVAMGNFEPYFDAKNQSGLFTELLDAVFDRLPNYHPRYQFGLSNHEMWGAFAGQRVDAVANVFDSVEVMGCRSDPIFRFKDVAVSLQSRNLKIDAIADLSGHSIVTFEGAYNFFGEDFARAVDLDHYKEVEKPGLQARMLLAGRFDVSVGDLLIFMHAMKSDNKAIYNPPPEVVIHTIFPQKFSRMAFHEAQICKAFNEALAAVKSSGEYEAIYQRYYTRYR